MKKINKRITESWREKQTNKLEIIPLIYSINVVSFYSCIIFHCIVIPLFCIPLFMDIIFLISLLVKY